MCLHLGEIPRWNCWKEMYIYTRLSLGKCMHRRRTGVSIVRVCAALCVSLCINRVTVSPSPSVCKPRGNGFFSGPGGAWEILRHAEVSAAHTRCKVLFVPTVIVAKLLENSFKITKRSTTRGRTAAKSKYAQTRWGFLRNNTTTTP